MLEADHYLKETYLTDRIAFEDSLLIEFEEYLSWAKYTSVRPLDVAIVNELFSNKNIRCLEVLVRISEVNNIAFETFLSAENLISVLETPDLD